MTSLLTEPQLIDTAAENVAEVRSAIGAAKAAAAGPTTRVAAAAADEVSAAAAKLFGSYAREYQAVLNRAAAFHDDFAAALTSAANAYTAAEAANASAISGALGGSPNLFRSVLMALAARSHPFFLAARRFDSHGGAALIAGHDHRFDHGRQRPADTPAVLHYRRLNYFNQNFTVLPSDAVALFTPEGLIRSPVSRA